MYAILKWPQPALAHAEQSLNLCLSNAIGGFDLAFGYEAMARALSISNKNAEAGRFLKLSREAAEKIAKAEDREHVLKEFDSIQP